MAQRNVTLNFVLGEGEGEFRQLQQWSESGLTLNAHGLEQITQELRTVLDGFQNLRGAGGGSGGGQGGGGTGGGGGNQGGGGNNNGPSPRDLRRLEEAGFNGNEIQGILDDASQTVSDAIRERIGNIREQISIAARQARSTGDIPAQIQQELENLTNLDSQVGRIARQGLVRIEDSYERGILNIQRAQEEFDVKLAPNRLINNLFGLGDRNQLDVNALAQKHGIEPGQIQTGNAPLLDIRRLAAPETLQQVLFAGLFGGFTSGGLGALGGLAAGSTGAFAGSVIGQAISTQVHEFQSLAVEAFTHITESAREFQQAVISVGAVLQETTIVGGGRLGTADEVAANIQSARKIQFAAQQALTPLGITGESQAAFTQATFSGAANRGVILDANSLGTVVERVAAAASALRPDVAQNPTQARRDIEDILTGSPAAGRTQLGIALKPFAPELFGGFNSSEELIKATEKLEAFVTAIKNSGESVTQLNRVFGELNQSFQQFSDSLLQEFQPALKGLADVVSDPAFIQGARNIGGVLGNILTGNTKGLIDKTISGTQDNRDSAVKGITGLFNGDGIFSGLLHGADALTGGNAGKVVQALNLINVALDAYTTVQSKAEEVREVNPDVLLKNLLERAGIKGGNLGVSSLEAFRSSPEFKLEQLKQAEDLVKNRQEAEKQNRLKVPSGPLSVDQQLIENSLVGNEDFLSVTDRQRLELQKKLTQERAGNFIPGLASDVEAKDTFLAAERQKSSRLVDQELKDALSERAKLIFETSKRNTGRISPADQQSLDEADFRVKLSRQDRSQENIGRFAEEQDTIEHRTQRHQLDKQFADALRESQRAAVEQTRQFRQLTDSVSGTKDALQTFKTGLESTFASKDTQLIESAKRVKDLGGNPGATLSRILDDPEQLKAFQKHAAESQLNQLGRETGFGDLLAGAGGEEGGGPQLISRFTNSSGAGAFQRGLGRQENALGDAVDKVVEELDVLPRKLNEASQALQDLIDSLSHRLGITNNAPEDNPIARDVSNSINRAQARHPSHFSIEDGKIQRKKESDFTFDFDPKQSPPVRTNHPIISVDKYGNRNDIDSLNGKGVFDLKPGQFRIDGVDPLKENGIDVAPTTSLFNRIANGKLSSPLTKDVSSTFGDTNEAISRQIADAFKTPEQKEQENSAKTPEKQIADAIKEMNTNLGQKLDATTVAIKDNTSLRTAQTKQALDSVFEGAS